MVGILVSFWEGLFSGAMFVSGGYIYVYLYHGFSNVSKRVYSFFQAYPYCALNSGSTCLFTEVTVLKIGAMHGLPKRKAGVAGPVDCGKVLND